MGRDGDRSRRKTDGDQCFRRRFAGLILSCLCLTLLSAALFTACAGNKAEKTALREERLVIFSPHPLDFINPIVSEFEEQTGILVQVQTGGTGDLLAQVEAGGNPACDIFWGGSLSTTFPKQDLFEEYISKNEESMGAEFKNTQGNMTRFTDMPSVIMVNTNLIGDISVEGYGDLLNPRLKGRIAMCSPAASSSAYEHLTNMLYAMGNGKPEQGWDYVRQFCANLDGVLLERSSQVYQGVAQGKFAVGLTFEEAGAHYVEEKGPVRLVYMKEGVISKPDVVCIAKEAKHQAWARKFVDFVTDRDTQTMIVSQLSRRSVRTDVKAPEYLPEKQTLHMMQDDAELVSSSKEEWQRQFLELFSEVSGQ